MSTPAHREVVISLDPSGEARFLRGRVQVASEPDRPFAGWLGLLSALEAAVESLGIDGGGEVDEPPHGGTS